MNILYILCFLFEKMMTDQNKELEVKFHVRRLEELEQGLIAMGAVLSQPRIHEVNLRFDTPDLSLKRSGQVLRLRQDTLARMTYKGLGADQGGVSARTEIEFVVSDFSAARALIEALGYRVSMLYEKYRTVYDLEGAHVALDQMPYGGFVEIEGADPLQIKALAGQLGLDWERRVLASYADLFDRLRSIYSYSFTDLSFANFQKAAYDLAVLGVLPAF